jgi:GH15 family glucan-1,4-alpha-glucosidase
MIATAPIGTSPDYAPIEDHAIIGDGRSAALVRRDLTIDWCCLPRFDSPSVFGRLLDADRGGAWELTPRGTTKAIERRYLERSLVLESRVVTEDGEATVTDLFEVTPDQSSSNGPEVLRIIDGVRGTVTFRTTISARFDYGRTRPWLQSHGDRWHSAIGGANGLVIWCQTGLDRSGEHDLVGEVRVRSGERRRLFVRAQRPELIEGAEGSPEDRLDRSLRHCLDWWRDWFSHAATRFGSLPGALRSAAVLRALIYAPTGAMVAALTTSLPEHVGGSRNWDYRYSWIRDSSFAIRALGEIGFEDEADAFRRFVERSAAGSGKELQVLYGIAGERWVPEVTIDRLEGYRRSKPVRVGNGAAHQTQLGIYGDVVDISWQRHLKGRSPDAEYRRFLAGIADEVAERWTYPDRGIWEIRGAREHFVHSKVMCWVALDRIVRMAEGSGWGWGSSTHTWAAARGEIRTAVLRDGYDEVRGVFRRAFGSDELDASLLLLASYGFVQPDDPRMMRTMSAIKESLMEDGLVLRYRAADGLEGPESPFLACSFWLAECLAHAGRVEEAIQVFERAEGTGNDLGLFAEESDPRTGEMRGNFPQALTHLAHIGACVALSDARPNRAQRVVRAAGQA